MPRNNINHQDDVQDFSTQVEKVPSISVFAYTADIGGVNNSIFEPQSHTICYLSETPEVYQANIESFSEDMQLLNTASKMRDGMMKLSNLVSLKIILSQDITKTLNNKNIFFTLNKALDTDAYEQGNQAVYFYSGKYSDNFVFEGQENNYKNVKQGEKVEKMKNQQNRTTFELQDVRTLDSMQNSALHFTFEKRWKDFNRIDITCDTSFFPTQIKGIATKDGDNSVFEEVQFKLSEFYPTKVGIVKLVPISTKGKLTLFVETNDYQSNLPWAVANAYIQPRNLRAEIVRGDEVWEKDLWQTFLSILELTNAFSTGFSAYTVDGGGSIDPAAQIGDIKISLLPSINYADAQEVIDGRIEAYTQKWPKQIDTFQFRLFKTFLNMLTPYVKCKYALGGGLNHANKIDSLFYFDLRTSVVKGLANSDASGIEVQLKSSYFDFNETTKEMTIKDDFLNVSKYKTINANGWVSFAELPDQATALPRPAIQGDKDANDEDITKYFSYVLFKDKDKMEEFYGSLYSFDKNTPNPTQITTNKSSEEEFVYERLKGTPPDLSKYTKQYIGDTFIKPSLSPNQTLKELSGEYDITNILVSKTDEEFYVPGAITSDVKTFIRTTVTITYNFTIIQTGNIYNLELKSENTIIDKLDAFTLNNYNNGNSTENVWTLKIFRENKLYSINELSEITIEGFFGDWLELSSTPSLGGLPLDFNKPLGKMNFASKYNEKKLSTKINL